MRHTGSFVSAPAMLAGVLVERLKLCLCDSSALAGAVSAGKGCLRTRWPVRDDGFQFFVSQ